MELPYGRGEARDWALERMRGVFNVVIPSYTSDLNDINEAGIRHDVQTQLSNGFAGYLTVSETSLTSDEYIKFVEIATDEGQGEQLVIHHASFNTLEENIEVANRAVEAGAQLALFSYPPNFYPQSEEDIYEYTRSFCEQVDIAVMLFPVPLWGFEHIHPASLSINLIERLVDDMPTIVAVKAEGGHPSIGGFTEVWNHLHHRIVVTMPLEIQAIPLATILPLQCIATSNTEYFGNAIPQMLQMANDGKNDEAMRLYWQVDPARRANGGIGAIGGANTVHRMAWKYQAWLNGYNGGPLRMPTSRLVSDQMRMLRKGLVDSGLPVTDSPDEDYWVGRNPT
jgi:4-hydroxy-tetrahydrodipicolinate synthase